MEKEAGGVRDAWISAALQSQAAVTAYLKSKQLLQFGFARIGDCKCLVDFKDWGEPNH